MTDQGWVKRLAGRFIVFDGPDGAWDIDLGYFDENDGAAQLAVSINGVEIDSWVWDQDLGSPNAKGSTKAVRAIDGVELHAGDILRIAGTANGGEPLRVDFLDFAYVEELV